MGPFQNFVYPQFQQYGNYNPYQQQQPMQPMPQQMPQGQQYMQPATPQIQSIAGKFVDSIESVRATDVMMDGSVMVFPSTDGKVVYTKQLQPDGTSRILTYTVAEGTPMEDSSTSILGAVESSLKAFREDIFSGLDDVIDRIDKVEKSIRGRGKEAEK